MKILLLGKRGQVGWELQRALSPLGQLTACGHDQVDLTDLDRLVDLVGQVKPDVIVNAAAYTAVDQAESDGARAHCINAEAPGVLAQEACRLGAWLVHYSTDYVFDGAKQGAYVEDDVTNPLSVYGQTKLDGERLIEQSGCKHLTLRTSWVYAARGNNFAKTMLRLARQREALNVVADQIGAPTSAELIADITSLMLYRLVSDGQAETLSGIYHLAAGGHVSWHGYAQFLLEHARAAGMDLKVKPEAVRAIATEDYPLPAVRPKNSLLNTTKLIDTFKVTLPHWQAHLQRMIEEISHQG